MYIVASWRLQWCEMKKYRVVRKETMKGRERMLRLRKTNGLEGEVFGFWTWMDRKWWCRGSTDRETLPDT